MHGKVYTAYTAYWTLSGRLFLMVSPRETRFSKGKHSPREIKPIYPVGFSPRESNSARETIIQITQNRIQNEHQKKENNFFKKVFDKPIFL